MFPENLRPQVLIEYWRSDNFIVNVGDYLNEVIIDLLGYAPICYSDADHQRSHHKSCLLAIGSVLDVDWIRRIQRPKNIWGSGFWGDSRLTPNDLEDCTIHAVRGPLTRTLLNLPKELPLGDPALLLSRLAPLSRQSDSGVVYIPHFNSRMTLSKNILKEIGANKLLDPGIRRDQVWDFLQTIVDSELVLTASLHGAIIAQAYGRPWALCRVTNKTYDKPLKWTDWFMYLGIKTVFCENAIEATRWWKSVGKYGTVRDLDPLLSAFPKDSIVTTV